MLDQPSLDWTSDFKNYQSRLDFIRYTVRKSAILTEIIRLRLIDAVDIPTLQKYKSGVVLTNNWIDPAIVDSSKFETFLPSFYAIYEGRPSVDNLYPTHNFNCFIKRMDTIRQSWFYMLIRRGFLENGLVSFVMDISRHKQYTSVDPMQVFEDQFVKYNQCFEPEHMIAKKIVPYCNFDDSNLNSIILKTKYSIVLETYFDSNFCITFSEKIFRCLKLPRPWVLFCNLNAVSKLREYGFDVLDDIVDHRYDSIIDPRQRETAILNQCEVLNNLEYTPSLMSRLEQSANHNNVLLEKFKDTYNKDIEDAVNRAIAKCH